MTCWRCSGVISLHWRLDCSSVLLAIFSDGWAAYAVSCHFGTWHGHTSLSTNDSCSAAGILGIMECTENDYCGLSCWDVCFHGISLTGIALYGHLWLKVHVTGKLSCCNSSCIVNDFHKTENSVSPSCLSKPEWLSFLHGAQKEMLGRLISFSIASFSIQWK